MIQPKGKVVHYGYRPGEAAYVQIDELHIAAWCPDDHALEPPTQVHMEIKIKDVEIPMMARFLGPDTLGWLIEQLANYRYYVWPDSPPVRVEDPASPKKPRRRRRKP